MEQNIGCETSGNQFQIAKVQVTKTGARRRVNRPARRFINDQQHEKQLTSVTDAPWKQSKICSDKKMPISFEMGIF